MPEASVSAPLTTVAAGPFTSMEALRRAHADLRQSISKDDSTKKSAHPTAADIRAFIARARATGAVLTDESERKAAQGILDYWSTELVSLPSAAAGDFTPAMLVPFDRTSVAAPAGAPTATSATASPAAPEKLQDDQSRELIRLAAAARLWRDSDRQYGYLLLDKTAIAQAARFRDLDPDISQLVTASEIAARTRIRVTIYIVIALGVVLFSVVVGLLWFSYVQKRDEAEYSNLLAKKASAQLEQARTATEELQNKIDVLQKQLRANRIPIAGDSTSTETVRPDVAQTIRLDKTGLDKTNHGNLQPAYQDGFIWIGSDTTGSNNLENATTKAPIMPSDVAINGRYRVTKSLVFRAGAPSRSDYGPTDSNGVVPEGALVTALAIPDQPYLRPTGNQYWLKIRIERSQAPTVYLQYTTAPAASVTPVAKALRERGYQIPGIEATQLAKNANEVRYYYAEDRDAAVKLADDVTTTLRSFKYTNMAPTKPVDLTASAGKRNYRGVIELWLDLPAVAQ